MAPRHLFDVPYLLAPLNSRQNFTDQLIVELTNLPDKINLAESRTTVTGAAVVAN